MRWILFAICAIWLFILLFVMADNNIKHALFFIGLAVFYLVWKPKNPLSHE